MRGISYKWRQQLANTGYEESVAALGYSRISRWPTFNRGNLSKMNNRVKAYLFGVQCAKEMDEILKREFGCAHGGRK